MAATAGPSSLLLRSSASSSGFGLGALDSIDTALGGAVGDKDPDDPKKSFTEAGMLSPISKNNNSKHSMSLSELPFLQDVVKQVSVKGLSKTVNMHFQHELAEQKIKKEEARLEARRKQLWEMRPENRESARPGAKGEGKEDKTKEEMEAQAAEMSFIETKEKVQSLSQVLADRRRMIALNDKLCKDEGKLKPRKDRRSAPALRADDEERSSDEDESAGARPALLSFGANKALASSQSTSALEGPYQAPNVGVEAYKRGVTLAATQMSGDLGPGGMGLLRQRMHMYEALSGLPASRKAVESIIMKKKRDAEEEAAMKLKNAPIPLKVAQVHSACDEEAPERETVLPQTLNVLRRIMDKTQQF